MLGDGSLPVQSSSNESPSHWPLTPIQLRIATSQTKWPQINVAIGLPVIAPSDINQAVAGLTFAWEKVSERHDVLRSYVPIDSDGFDAGFHGPPNVFTLEKAGHVVFQGLNAQNGAVEAAAVTHKIKKTRSSFFNFRAKLAQAAQSPDEPPDSAVEVHSSFALSHRAQNSPPTTPEGYALPYIRANLGNPNAPTAVLYISPILIDPRSALLIAAEFKGLYLGNDNLSHVEKRLFYQYAKKLIESDRSAALKYWENQLKGANVWVPKPGGLAAVLNEKYPASRKRDSWTSNTSRLSHMSRASRLSRASHHKQVSQATFKQQAFDIDLDAYMSVVKQFNVPPGVLLAAMWALVVSIHEHSEDVLVAVDVQDPKAGSVLGRTNINFPLRVGVNPDATLEDLINSIAADFAQGCENGFVGIDAIMENSKNAGGHRAAQQSLSPPTPPRGNGTLTRKPSFTPSYHSGRSGMSNNSLNRSPGSKNPPISGSAIQSIVHCDLDTIQPGFANPADLHHDPRWLLAIHGTITATSQELRVAIQYPDNVPDEKIRILVNHCMMALKNIVTEPTTPVSEVDFVCEEEAEILLDMARARESQAKVDQNDVLHRKFEKIAKEHPERVAVQFFNPPESITYKELNQLSNQLARVLRGNGLKPDSIVPICMDRSIDLIMTIIAVLKAGGAYTVLEPRHSTSRNVFIVTECAAPVFLVSKKYADAFRADASIRSMLVIEDVKHKLEMYPTSDSVGSSAPSNLAYVIYTSGSTGKPKGVLIEHQSALAGLQTLLLLEMNGLDELPRALLFYNPIFSAAQRAIFGTLMIGGTLCLASDTDLTVDLPKVLKEMDISHVGLTPSATTLLTDHVGEQILLPRLKEIRITGEPARPGLVRKLQAFCSHPLFMVSNAFGLSEVPMLNMSTALDRRSIKNPNILSRPKDTTSLYVLTKSLKLVPLGTVGELCFSGPQLARSYLKRPELTAAAFIDNPYKHGERLYRTGDEAIINDDGTVVIIGRKDFQVKVDGQKVDVSEIVDVVRRDSRVDTCVVVECDLVGQNMLIAFVSAKKSSDAIGCCLTDPDAGPTQQWMDLAADLRRQCKEYLPPYYAPRLWLPVSSLPTLSSGKVDYNTLKSLASSMGLQKMLSFTVTASDTKSMSGLQEEILQKAWAKVLSIPSQSISANHSFAELGGSSLQAMRVASICRGLGYNVHVTDIITAESLGALAQKLELLDESTVQNDDVPAFSLVTPAHKESVIRDYLVPKGLTENDVEDMYPTTPLQEALVALHLQDLHKYMYQRVYRVGRGVDMTKLRDAWTRVVAQSPILRTTFAVSDSGSMLNVVLKDVAAAVWDVEPAVVELDEFLRKDKDVRMELGAAHIRVAHLRPTTETDALLVFTIHHSLFDYWSSKFSFEDLAALYKDETATVDRPAFSKLIRHIESENKASADSFWGRYLDEATESRLEVATTGVEPESICVRERVQNLEIRKVAASLGVTPGSVIYAAWALVVSRFTGTDDVIFGTTLSGREANLDGITRINGPALTIVPQRVKVVESSTIQEHIQQTDARFWGMMKYSSVGVRRALAQGGHSATLFNTLVNILVQDDSTEPQEWPITRYEKYRSVYETEYITVDVEDQPDGTLEVRITCDKSKFPLQNAEFCLTHLTNALLGFANQPEGTIAELDLLGDDERRLLASLSPAPKMYDGDMLHREIEEYALSTPTAPALHFLGQNPLSYQDMNMRANQLAHYLISKGVKPESIVALCLPKSYWMYIAILAILKAGGAYVPMDPENPLERLHFIVEECRSPIAFVEKADMSLLDGAMTEVVAIDRLDLSSYPTSNPIVLNLHPYNLAYIIFTSGSTGAPKGTLLTHENASTSLRSMAEVYGSSSNSRCLQFSNYVWDASIYDIFVTLSTGGTLCSAPKNALLTDLAGVINKLEVTEMLVTPTVAKLVQPEQVPNFKLLIMGGEAPTPELYAKWGKSCRVINVYGPTEVCVVSTTRTIQVGENPRAIGSPLASVRVYLMAPNSHRLAPYGGVGEIVLAGPQVGRGYLNRPIITERLFTANPFVEGERMYLSGDLARYLSDNSFEFLGRRDQQIKLNGLRIELGEIENAIMDTELVDDAVVVVGKLANDVEALVAFLTLPEELYGGFEPGNEEGAAALVAPMTSAMDEQIELLQNNLSLPTHMLPKLYIPLTNFPLTQSGKTDLKALKAYIRSLTSTDIAKDGGTPPQTDAENALAKAISEVLSVDVTKLGLQSSFSSLGGDSIRAISVVAKCKIAGYELEIIDVLKNPKLGDMAKVMRKKKAFRLM
ncbi:hypothetical protein HDV00_005812 [Rhizophlyctis rosea]|nr:hypothetical protein HDV00_005812 [Rhizophlyctis rosea]